MPVKSKFQDILHSFSLSELIEMVRHKAQMEAESTMDAARKHLSALAHAVGVGSENKPKRSAKSEKSAKTTPSVKSSSASKSSNKAKGKAAVQTTPAPQAALNAPSKKKNGKVNKSKKSTARKTGGSAASPTA